MLPRGSRLVQGRVVDEARARALGGLGPGDPLGMLTDEQLREVEYGMDAVWRHYRNMIVGASAKGTGARGHPGRACMCAAASKNLAAEGAPETTPPCTSARRALCQRAAPAPVASTARSLISCHTRVIWLLLNPNSSPLIPPWPTNNIGSRP